MTPRLTSGAPPMPSDDQWRRWGLEPAWSRRIDVPASTGGHHTWHLIDRPADGEPALTLLCVHGNPTWAYLWQRLLVGIDPHVRVVAVDQLGMGFSERTGPRDYEQRVRDLGDVVRALELTGPVVVAAHDWGGAIAMGWSLDPQVELAGLVLCNTGIAVPTGRHAPRLIRLAATSALNDVVCRHTRTFVNGTIALARGRLTAADRDALRAPYRRAADRHAIAEFVADAPLAPDHPSAPAIAAVAERLGEISVPVLLSWGAADPVFDDSFAADLAARLPHADRHRSARSSHLSPLETDLDRVVGAWLHDRVSSVGPVRSGRVAAPTAAPPWAALDERRDDPSPAFVDGATGTSTSFADLHRRILGVARGLTAAGLRPGDRVAVLVPPSAELLSVVYGCWRAGAVTVIADRGLGLRGLGAAVRGARVQWVIGPPAALAAARTMRWARGARSVAVGDRRTLGAVATLAELEASTAPLPPTPSADAPAAVLYTSGATGPAKGVRYLHGQLAAQRDALMTTYGITADDRLVAAFAPFALYGPAMGITSTIPDVDVTTPGALTHRALADACSAVGATLVFASPAALANVIRTAPPPGEGGPALTGLRMIFSAGAPVPVGTLRALRRLCPSAEVHTPYGMTECLPVADISLHGIEEAITSAGGTPRGVCVGSPVAGAEVMIAPLGFEPDLAPDALPPGTTGEVLVRAPWCSDGYDQLFAVQHDARPLDEGARVWHRSGDVGHVDADGRVWIEGRSVHVIHAVSGAVTPVPVEVAVETAVDVERSAAVGVGPHGCQQLVVVLEQPDAAEGLASLDRSDEVRRVVREALDLPVAAVLSVRSLPVDIRHNTKIDRTAVATWAHEVLAGGSTRRAW